MKLINIIYFACCNKNENYKNIINGQLDDIIYYGILKKAKLYVEFCCEDTKLIPDVIKFFQDKLSNYDYEIKFHTENRYEYYGIKKMYDLAILEPDKYFIYLQSKAIFNYNINQIYINERHNYEKTLTKGTLCDYENIIKIFNDNPNVMKAGLFPSNVHKQNFIWLNFYWIKGKYLVTCENPIISDNRYYYETWSETGNNDMTLVYNIYENNYKKYFLNEVGDILNKLNGSFYRGIKVN